MNLSNLPPGCSNADIERQSNDPYESNCLVFEDEPKFIRDLFGDRFWNDTEDIRCIPIGNLNSRECNELRSELGVDTIKFDFIICL